MKWTTRTRILLLGSCGASAAMLACSLESDDLTKYQALAYGEGPAAIPGRLEAEHYDEGGVGEAYSDTTAGNSGGELRSDDVDIEASSQGGYNIGWIAAGEWLDYTVSVADAGPYLVTASVASLSAGGTFHLEVAGQDISGPIEFAATGGWQEWTTVETEVDLSAGEVELRVVADSSSFNIDYLDFEFVGVPGDGQSPYSGTPASVPGVIEVENYDLGGVDVAYSDSTAGNSGGAYRDDDVDLEASSLGGVNVGWLADGEWLEYTVDAASGTYDITLTVASLTNGGALHFEVDGVDVSGPILFAATGGWQTWQEVSGQLTLPEGTSVLRLVSEGSGFNVDSFELSEQGAMTSDPTCSTGLLNAEGTACCDAACGSCGGTGCDTRPGGADSCCTSGVTASGVSCSGALPPCVMDVDGGDGGGGQPPTSSGNISPLLVGNNVWLNPSDSVWNVVSQAGLKIVRIGGHAYDDNIPSNSQLTEWVNRIKAMGAEPMIQVSQYDSAASAADLVRYFNVETGNTVKYWNLGNEPWLQAGKPSVSSVAPMVEGYLKPRASAMKAVDPSIKIIAPDVSWYIDDMFNSLLGGANDIAGRDANGNYYIDGISWHKYSEPGSLASGLHGDIQKAREDVDRANQIHGRTGDDALIFGIGEFNSNAGSGGTCSFELGQAVARVYGSLMEYGGSYGALWSFKEGGSSCSGTDFGFLNGDNSPRPSYYHMQMVSQNFYGDYADGSDNIGSLYSYGAVADDQIAVMLVNEGGSQTCNVRLNSDSVGGGCQVNIDAGTPVTFSQSIGSDTTMVLVFDRGGNLQKRVTYSSGGTPQVQNL